MTWLRHLLTRRTRRRQGADDLEMRHPEDRATVEEWGHCNTWRPKPSEREAA